MKIVDRRARWLGLGLAAGALLLTSAVSISDGVVTMCLSGLAVMGYRRHDTTGWVRERMGLSG